MRGWQWARLAVPGEARPEVVRAVRLQIISGSDYADVIGCKRFDDPNETTVWVAKDPYLRRSPFDSLAPYNAPDRDGVRYEYISHVRRTAIIVANPDLFNVETVIPTFKNGDEINAVRADTGLIVPGSEDEPVTWLDLSPREWVVEAS